MGPPSWKKPGPSLPSSLVKGFDTDESSDKGSGPRRFQKSRKESRKEARQQKKEKQRQFHMTHKVGRGSQKRPHGGSDDGPARKKPYQQPQAGTTGAPTKVAPPANSGNAKPAKPAASGSKPSKPASKPADTHNIVSQPIKKKQGTKSVSFQVEPDVDGQDLPSSKTRTQSGTVKSGTTKTTTKTKAAAGGPVMTPGVKKRSYGAAARGSNKNFFKLLEQKRLISGPGSLEEEEDEDDRIIRDMAKKLGLKPGKKLPSSFAEDGLGYLLFGSDEEDHALDEDDVGLGSKGGSQKGGRNKGGNEEYHDDDEGSEGMDGSDGEMDEMMDGDDVFEDEMIEDDMEEGDGYEMGESEQEDGMMFGESEGEEGDEDDVIEDEGEEDEMSEGEGEEDEGIEGDEEENEYIEEDAEEDELSEGEVEESEMSEGEEGEGSEGTEEEGEEEEGDKRDAVKEKSTSESAGSKYVPPHLRKSLAGDEALRRRVKGQLNKLNDTTFVAVVGEIEGLYMANSRHAMNQVLVDLVLELLLASTRQMDRLTILYSGLLAALHNVVGMEVGAYFLQTVTERFEALYKEGFSADDKRCTNLMAVLGHLYNFKVIYCGLIYDYIRRFVQSFKEADVEMLLLLLQSVGPQLRSDDPTALKDIIMDVQEQARKNPDLMTPASRGKYMVECMMDLKNNKAKPRLGADDTTHLVSTLRQMLGGLRRSKTSTGGEATLRVSLEDILNAKDRGRWWLVGSAWKGREETQYKQPVDELMPDATGEVSRLQEMARSLRMNTDIRRAVFMVIMRAEDIADAFEKLVKLNLKDKQEREIVKVAVECCMHEKTYNPYYTHLVAKFCHFNYNHKFTLQYTVWDRLKDLPHMSVRQMLHLARMLVFLIVDFAISLAVFKVVQFTEMDKHTLAFFRMFFTQLLTETPEEKVRQLFRRIAPNKSLALLKEQLSAFLHMTLLKGVKDERQRQQLKRRVDLVRVVLRESAVAM